MEMEEVCEAFKAKVGAAFPNCYLNVRPVLLLGEKVIIITFANVPRREDATNGILENANGFMKALVDFDPIDGYNVERPTMHYRDKAIKFRVLKAPTQAEVMDKLAAWFIKNHDLILASKPSWK